MPQKTHGAPNAAGQARYRYGMQSRRRVPKRAVKSRVWCAPRARDVSHSIVLPRVMARKQASRCLASFCVSLQRATIENELLQSKTNNRMHDCLVRAFGILPRHSVARSRAPSCVREQLTQATCTLRARGQFGVSYPPSRSVARRHLTRCRCS